MADTSVGQAAIAAADAAAASKPAANIAKAVTQKATGIPTGNVPAKEASKESAVPAQDPNAGKEKYVVNGKEVFLSPEQARAYVQKGLAFEPKMSEFGRLQQETAQFLQTLKTDPEKILFNDKLGLAPDEVLKKIMGSTKVSDSTKEIVGKWYYENVVAPEALSPQERERAEMTKKLANYEAMVEQQKQEGLQRENDARVQAALNLLKGQISEAMSEAGVPLDSKVAPSLARRVAQVMQMGHRQGKAISPKEAMAKVKAEVFEYQKSYYDMLDEDKLVEQIGKENAEKVRKYFLKQVKDKESAKHESSGKAPKRDVRKTMNSDDFHDYLQELKNKGK